MGKVCIFDVDGTLSRGFYIVKFPEVLYQEGLFPQRELMAIREIFSEYTKGANYQYEQFAWDLVKAFGRGVKGKKQKDIENVGKRYIKSHQDEKFQFTDNLVKLVKSKGYRTAVISGSPYEIIFPFSRSLEIDDTFATTYETEKDIFTGGVVQNCAVNEMKRQIVEKYMKEHDSDSRSSSGFGDSHHDLGFLEMVGYPIALNPNAKLEEVARGRKWLVCHENDKILDSVKSYLP